jgi:hypothetical protein
MRPLLIALDHQLSASTIFALGQHYAKTQAEQPFTYQSRAGRYGGYSLTSSTAEVTDGWVGAGGLMHTKQPDGSYQRVPNADAVRKQHGILPLASYNHPTPIHTGAAALALQQLADLFGQPMLRSRYGVLQAGGMGGWHVDGEHTGPGVWRIHVPILTHPAATFQWRSGGQECAVHMPAGGSIYLTRINTEHRIVNPGPTDRVHLHTMTNAQINPSSLPHHVLASF